MKGIGRILTGKVLRKQNLGKRRYGRIILTTNLRRHLVRMEFGWNWLANVSNVSQ
jgi:hypothetical protein